MKHHGRLSETPSDLSLYSGHSEGHERRALIGRATGSVHQEVVIAELAPGGHLERHLHAFGEAFYVLEGSLTLEIAGTTEKRAPLRNAGCEVTSSTFSP